MRSRVVALVAATVATVATMVTSGAPAGAAAVCPPNPPPGSSLVGPVDVTGTCVLTNVLVSGSITVENGGALELERSEVDGNITVLPGGELFVGHVADTGIATYNQSVINGSVVITDAPDSDLDGAVVNGDVTVNGIRTPAFITICGSRINGQLTVSNAGFLIGDPDGEQFRFENGVTCTGNVIGGSVRLTNIPPPPALFLRLLSELEANTINGSVEIDQGRVALEDNTIYRDVLCSPGGSVTGADESLSTNRVAGTFACPTSG